MIIPSSVNKEGIVVSPRVLWFALFFIGLWGLFPSISHAQDEPLLLRDDSVGYVLALPSKWIELSGEAAVTEQVNRLCSFFIKEGEIPGAFSLRAALLPEDEVASPAMVIFSLSYPSLGLRHEEVQEMAKDSEAITAGLANALQTSYMQAFPQSIMINNHLSEEFFSLNLRTVLDFENEQETTRNRYLKVMLTAVGAVVLVAQYDGPPNSTYDRLIATSVRNLGVLPEKALRTVNPPFKPTIFDYILLFFAVIAVVILVRKLAGVMRG